MDYNDLAYFVRVVRSGGIGAAARELDVPKSTISRGISRLEATLGVSLLDRATRRAFPTQEGGQLYSKCARLFAEADEAVRQLGETSQEPCGVLKLVAQRCYEAFLTPVLSTYASLHTSVRIEAAFTNRALDVLEEGIDIAITKVCNQPTELLVRPLGALKQTLCASPAYLARAGRPDGPLALNDHAIAASKPSADFRLGGKALPLEARFAVESVALERALTLEGQSIALLPNWLIQPDLDSGRLVTLLDAFPVAPDEPCLVGPPSRFVSARVSAFISILEAHLRSCPGWSPTQGSLGSDSDEVEAE
jgi:DNA-binding transcriptional LysR family regulator